MINCSAAAASQGRSGSRSRRKRRERNLPPRESYGGDEEGGRTRESRRGSSRRRWSLRRILGILYYKDQGRERQLRTTPTHLPLPRNPIPLLPQTVTVTPFPTLNPASCLLPPLPATPPHWSPRPHNENHNHNHGSDHHCPLTD